MLFLPTLFFVYYTKFIILNYNVNLKGGKLLCLLASVLFVQEVEVQVLHRPPYTGIMLNNILYWRLGWLTGLGEWGKIQVAKNSSYFVA